MDHFYLGIQVNYQYVYSVVYQLIECTLLTLFHIDPCFYKEKLLPMDNPYNCRRWLVANDIQKWTGQRDL